MDKNRFQQMWEKMQSDGYFSRHPHYEEHFGIKSSESDRELDRQVLAMDFGTDEVFFPVPYSAALERSVKRTEAFWLPKMFELPTSGNALDVGCGYGRSLAWLAEHYERVVGTDISPSAIVSARKFLAGRSNVELMVNGADSLPDSLANKSFDIVYVFTVFQHIPREFTAGLLRDIHRVLKPGSSVIFNLVSNINEAANEGQLATEWAIGYSLQSVHQLLADCDLQAEKIVRWSGPESEVSWLWVKAARPG